MMSATMATLLFTHWSSSERATMPIQFWPAITTDLYNPTMDVLISGVLTDGGVEDHKYNAIGRKLKTGDRLCLLYYAALNNGSNASVTFEMNFSVLS